MARVKMVALTNPNIPNMTFLANLMELKKGKFTAEVTQFVHLGDAFTQANRTLAATIEFSDLKKLEKFCSNMRLMHEGNHAWMVIEAFKNDAEIEPAQQSFDFDNIPVLGE